MLKKKTKKKDPKVLVQNRDDIARALEILFAEGYISRHKLYFENFVRGMFFTAGGIIGATVLIAFILWALSLFDSVPLVGPFFENVRQTIENSKQQ